MDGSVSASVSDLEFGGRWFGGCRTTSEQAVAQRAADPLVEQREQESNADPFVGQLIAVTGALALEKAVSPQLPRV